MVKNNLNHKNKMTDFKKTMIQSASQSVNQSIHARIWRSTAVLSHVDYKPSYVLEWLLAFEKGCPGDPIILDGGLCMAENEEYGLESWE